ncbi:Syntaxin-related protein KNOLLE, partial [Frankliniella fusca]
MTIHFDGLKINPLTGGDTFIERLPIVVTGENCEQLFGARIIKDGSGQAQALEVAEQMKAWGCVDQVWCVCTDTTSSNTGVNKGAVVLLEAQLNRKLLLFLACRHHMLDIIPKHVFEKLIESSSSPDLGTLCKNLKKTWPGMDHKNFKTAICDFVAPQCCQV